MISRRLSSFVLLSAVLATPLAAQAFPGQKIIGKTVATMRKVRAEEYRTKQEAVLIDRNPTLAAVRDAKILEYKAAHPLALKATMLSLLPSSIIMAGWHKSIVEGIVGTGAIALSLFTTGAIDRNHDAKKYAHEQTLGYAQKNGIPLGPPGLELIEANK